LAKTKGLNISLLRIHEFNGIREGNKSAAEGQNSGKMSCQGTTPANVSLKLHNVGVGGHLFVASRRGARPGMPQSVNFLWFKR